MKKKLPPVAMAWYREKDWPRIREISADGKDLEDNFWDWLAHAKTVEKKTARKGFDVERVLVDPDELLAWSRERSLAIDGNARSRFAVEKLQQSRRGESLDSSGAPG